MTEQSGKTIFSYLREMVSVSDGEIGENILDTRDGAGLLRLDQRLSNAQELTDRTNLLHLRPSDCAFLKQASISRWVPSAAVCHELIDSIAATDGNETPILVRRAPAGASAPFELVTGVRRHFAVNWLNHNGRPEMLLLAQVVDMDDEAAFRANDLENRQRTDICELARAFDYRSALNQHYGGVQSRMAEALELSNSHLSRLLALAELPAEVVASFGRQDDIKVRHSEILTPLLRDEASRARMIAEARRINHDQQELSTQSSRLLPAAQVLARLKDAAESTAPRKRPAVSVNYRDRKLGTISREEDGAIRVDASKPVDVTAEDFTKALINALVALEDMD